MTEVNNEVVKTGEVPEGEYIANLVNYTEKPTKAGDGLRGSLEFKIKKGDYKTRSLFLDLNLKNKNSEAVRISIEQLNKFFKAMGLPEFGGDTTRIFTDDTVDDVIIVVKQKLERGYTNSAGIVVPEKMRSKITSFKPR